MIFDEILTSLQLSFNLSEFLNCYIYYSVEADGDTSQQIHLLNLEKTKALSMIKKIQNYKNLFEKIKIKSNENYYASLLNKYNYDTKRT